MNRILARAATLINDESYTRKFAVGTATEGQTFVQDRKADRFSLSGAIEHAAALIASGGGQSVVLRPANGEALAEAKAVLCRHLRAVHLDAWELDKKPDAARVRSALLEAA